MQHPAIVEHPGVAGLQPPLDAEAGFPAKPDEVPVRTIIPGDLIFRRVERPAADVRIDLRELLRRFSSRLGTSPKAFYIDLRLTLACRLLENTDQSVSTIAATCGLDFARAFKQRFGMNPSELRHL
jgi:AraC-like DNA-binding protein